MQCGEYQKPMYASVLGWTENRPFVVLMASSSGPAKPAWPIPPDAVLSDETKL